MGGKGKRRREKNYRAAHGGYSGLPPPPNPSQLDALPSKLRQIMSFSQHQNGPSLSLSPFISSFLFLMRLLSFQGLMGRQRTKISTMGMPKM